MVLGIKREGLEKSCQELRQPVVGVFSSDFQ